VLDAILSQSGTQEIYNHLMVGNDTRDDAAVLDLGNGHCLISSVDFFTPVVDDAFDFGQIAAANAISDIYAMGGQPNLAIAILGFPSEKLDASVAGQMLAGAKAVCTQAGIPLAGGHSIEAPEPFFGLSVNGIVKKEYIKTNKDGKAGDLLFLTKPLGSGIMNTAVKRDLCKEDHYTVHIQNIKKLNDAGLHFGACEYIHAITDITGFSLLGHLCEITEFSSTSAELYKNNIPAYPFIDEYLAVNCIPDNTYRNWNAYEKKINGLTDMKSFQLLNDPQTNGGLLVAIDPSQKDTFIHLLNTLGLELFTTPIGQLTEKKEQLIYIV
jgi:selenide,water dikinase